MLGFVVLLRRGWECPREMLRRFWGHFWSRSSVSVAHIGHSLVLGIAASRRLWSSERHSALRTFLPGSKIPRSSTVHFTRSNTLEDPSSRVKTETTYCTAHTEASDGSDNAQCMQCHKASELQNFRKPKVG